jgi:hypothetical protein
MTIKIILQHTSGVKRDVEVKSASRYISRNKKTPCLEVSWPTAGVYTLDLTINALFLPKKIALWSAESINDAWAVWLVLCDKGKNQANHITELLKLIPKEFKESESVKLAIAFRRREQAA